MVRKNPVLLGLEWSESLLFSLVAAESSLHLSFYTVPAFLFLIPASCFFMASVLKEIYGTVVLLPRPMALPLLILPCNKNQLFNSSLCLNHFLYSVRTLLLTPGYQVALMASCDEQNATSINLSVSIHPPFLSIWPWEVVLELWGPPDL